MTWIGFGPDIKLGQRCKGGSVALTEQLLKLHGDDWQPVKTLLYSATPVDVHISQEKN